MAEFYLQPQIIQSLMNLADRLYCNKKQVLIQTLLAHLYDFSQSVEAQFGPI